MKNLFLKISNNIVKYLFTMFCILYAICNILFSYWINNVGYEKSINIGINLLSASIFVCFLFILLVLFLTIYNRVVDKFSIYGCILNHQVINASLF